MCEIGLYQAGLYALPTFQLTGVVAAYTLHRLYTSGKLTRNTATATSAVQLTKTAHSALCYLLKVETRDGSVMIVEIAAADFLTLLLFVGALVWLFVYETKGEVTVWEVRVMTVPNSLCVCVCGGCVCVCMCVCFIL